MSSASARSHIGGRWVEKEAAEDPPSRWPGLEGEQRAQPRTSSWACVVFRSRRSPPARSGGHVDRRSPGLSVLVGAATVAGGLLGRGLLGGAPSWPWPSWPPLFLAAVFLAVLLGRRLLGRRRPVGGRQPGARPTARRPARRSASRPRPPAQRRVGGAVGHVGTEASVLDHHGQAGVGVRSDLAERPLGAATPRALGWANRASASSRVTVRIWSSASRLRVSVPFLR